MLRYQPDCNETSFLWNLAIWQSHLFETQLRREKDRRWEKRSPQTMPWRSYLHLLNSHRSPFSEPINFYLDSILKGWQSAFQAHKKLKAVSWKREKKLSHTGMQIAVRSESWKSASRVEMRKRHKNGLNDQKHSNFVPWAVGKTALPASIGVGKEMLKIDSTLALSNQEN